jgi:4-amino-4-deoxy-L-arabinose transferase-like glycosyltransferase
VSAEKANATTKTEGFASHAALSTSWKLSASVTDKVLLLLLLLFSSSLYFGAATQRALLDNGDALYAHAAQQMLERDEWVTPYANGIRLLDHPPMMYWLMAVAFKLFDISEFAARLPSVLAVVGMGFLLYLTGKKAGGPPAGFTAATVGVFCAGTFLFTRVVFPDILFVFLLTLALYSFLAWHGDDRNPVIPAILFYASVAAAVLTNGLIGFLFPVSFVLLFAFGFKQWKRLRRFFPGWGMVLFLALVLPWHLLAAWSNPGFLSHYFMNQYILGFLGRRNPSDYESISLLLFWCLMLAWLFPWSAFLPAVRHLLHLAANPQAPSRAVIGLSLCWLIVVLLFVSFSSRIELDSLSAIPPLALLLGIALSPGNICCAPHDIRRQRSVERGFRFLARLGVFLGFLALIGVSMRLFGWGGQVRLESKAPLPMKVVKHYFAPMFEFPPEILSQLVIPLIGTGVVFAAGLVAAAWLNGCGLRIPAVGTLLLMMAAFGYFAFQSLGVCEETLSSRQFGHVLGRLYQPGDHVITVGNFEAANSINFYSRTPLQVYGGTAAALEWGLGRQDAPKRVLSKEDLASRWNGPERTFLLAGHEKLSALGLRHSYPVLQSAGRILICNQPVSLVIGH